MPKILPIGYDFDDSSPVAIPKLKAIAPWYGGKRVLAPYIVEQLGKHHCYWEPFCGSMAVLIAKPVCSHETVNDLNGDLINLARIIKDPILGARLYRRLRRILNSNMLLEEARDNLQPITYSLNGHLDIARAEAYFINSWMGMSGIAGATTSVGGRKGISRRFSSKGGSASVRFNSAVDSIPAWRQRLRRVTILNDDGLELCRKIEDREGTVIYVDPPYLDKTTKYLYDFSSGQHEELASILRRFKYTRVVVSYYTHPKLASLYPSWPMIPIAVSKGSTRHGFLTKDEGHNVIADEVLIVNGEVY